MNDYVMHAIPRQYRRLYSRGFTLIEVMVVIVILGIMAAMLVPKVMSRPDEARLIAVRQDIATVVQALKLYRLDTKRFPSSEQGLQVLVGRYLDKLPVDPWGHSYQYLNPGTRGEIDVWSWGGDGAAGGEGFDADIGNWDL